MCDLIIRGSLNKKYSYASLCAVECSSAPVHAHRSTGANAAH